MFKKKVKKSPYTKIQNWGYISVRIPNKTLEFVKIYKCLAFRYDLET